MKRYQFGLATVLLAAACGAAAVGAQQDAHELASRVLPQKYALLIAVDDYAEVQNLQYCNADIDALKAKLIDAGFPEEHVTVLRDKAAKSQYIPCKSNIEKQLELLLATAGQQDLVVVAFSGHGVHVDGASYLCPMDTQMDRAAGILLAKTLVPLEWVYKVMESCRAGQKLLLVDACRNDPNPGNTRSATASRSIADFAADLREPPRGILVLTACTPGQVSVEDPQFGHGVFMYYVIQGLEGSADRDHDGKISLLELYQYVEVRTKTHVRVTYNVVQTPELSGKISGDYEIALVPKHVTAPLPGPKPVGQGRPVAESGGARAAIGQADEFYRRGEFDKAVNAYDTVILTDPASKVLHLKRGAAHLANGDIEKAVIDYQLGGKPVPLTVAADQAPLRDGGNVTGTVRQGQTLNVTKVTRLDSGQWLWVASVDGNDAAQGWVLKDAVVRKPPTPPASPAPTPLASPATNYVTTPEAGSARGGNSRLFEPQEPDTLLNRFLDKAYERKYEGLLKAEEKGAPAGRLRVLERPADTQPRLFEGRRGRGS